MYRYIESQNYAPLYVFILNKSYDDDHLIWNICFFSAIRPKHTTKTNHLVLHVWLFRPQIVLLRGRPQALRFLHTQPTSHLHNLPERMQCTFASLHNVCLAKNVAGRFRCLLYFWEVGDRTTNRGVRRWTNCKAHHTHWDGRRVDDSDSMSSSLSAQKYDDPFVACSLVFLLFFASVCRSQICVIKGWTVCKVGLLSRR